MLAICNCLGKSVTRALSFITINNKVCDEEKTKYINYYIVGNARLEGETHIGAGKEMLSVNVFSFTVGNLTTLFYTTKAECYLLHKRMEFQAIGGNIRISSTLFLV